MSERRMKLFEAIATAGDNGTAIDFDSITEARITLSAPFHHMDANGYYDGWEDYSITLRPSFIGRISVTVRGRNRNDIKSYLAEMFEHTLTRDIIESADGYRFAPEA